MRMLEHAVKCGIQSPQDTTGLKGEHRRRQSYTRSALLRELVGKNYPCDCLLPCCSPPHVEQSKKSIAILKNCENAEQLWTVYHDTMLHELQDVFCLSTWTPNSSLGISRIRKLNAESQAETCTCLNDELKTMLRRKRTFEKSA